VSRDGVVVGVGSGVRGREREKREKCAFLRESRVGVKVEVVVWVGWRVKEAHTRRALILIIFIIRYKNRHTDIM